VRLSVGARSQVAKVGVRVKASKVGFAHLSEQLLGSGEVSSILAVIRFGDRVREGIVGALSWQYLLHFELRPRARVMIGFAHSSIRSPSSPQYSFAGPHIPHFSRPSFGSGRDGNLPPFSIGSKIPLTRIARWKLDVGRGDRLLRAILQHGFWRSGRGARYHQSQT
jgi:hypothetical protein